MTEMKRLLNQTFYGASPWKLNIILSCSDGCRSSFDAYNDRFLSRWIFATDGNFAQLLARWTVTYLVKFGWNRRITVGIVSGRQNARRKPEHLMNLPVEQRTRARRKCRAGFVCLFCDPILWSFCVGVDISWTESSSLEKLRKLPRIICGNSGRQR